jgi:uncharacterized pyridoxamine 5'-phosphate oxidase family protein
MKLPQDVARIMLAWFGYPDAEVICQVATTSKDQPHIRSMKLYGISENGDFIFITATSSRKWQDLQSSPSTAICLCSPQGQLTIEGSVVLLTGREEHALVRQYWQTLPVYWQKYYLAEQHRYEVTALPISFGLIAVTPNCFDVTHINKNDYLKSSRQRYRLTENSWIKKNIMPE